MIKDPCIIFKDVTIEYNIYNSRSLSVRNKLLETVTGGLIHRDTSHDVVTALDKASFALGPGDRIGLIGGNGAGKTTLLRAMAGIYRPVSGEVTIEGSVSTIIDIGAGMDEELSGTKNIFRLALLKGFQMPEIKKILPEICEFSGLGNYVDLPVRTYSSGMKMRLMFAVATMTNPDILLIDEMFATGDKDFQIKATKRIEKTIERSKIFVFASHDLSLVKKYCNKIFKMDHGTIIQMSTEEALGYI